MQSSSSFASRSSAKANRKASPEDLFRQALTVMADVKQQPEWSNAVKMLIQAANKGHVKACYALLKCYNDGLGVDVNYAKMHHWSRMAASYAVEEAKAFVAKGVEKNVPHEFSQEQSLVSCPGDDVANCSSDQDHEDIATGEVSCCEFDYVQQFAAFPEMFSAKSLYFDERALIVLNTILPKALKGVSEAQYLMGLYHLGLGENGMSWFELAAKQGHVTSIMTLAEYCEQNPSSYDPGFECLALAAPYSLNAAYNLGLCYMHGRGTVKNLEKAHDFFEYAAREGHRDACKFLNGIYFYLAKSLEDLGAYAANQERVEKYYLMAFERGCGSAKERLFDYKIKLANFLLQESTKKSDLTAAIKLCKQACKLDADLGVKKLVSVCLEHAKRVSAKGEFMRNWSIVEKCYKTAMKYGSQEGVNLLAQLYMEVANRYAVSEFEAQAGKAFDLYLKASEVGAKDAHVKLADCYLQGNGVEKNLDKAISYYQLAAKNNDKHALAG